eukprot:TRINITY_DN1018_c0_g6_i1.p1 TRINITY_DN1018_c0_g6~~TRINITY_DN1018_c0_g6_i1.p1  ORF type:complete len:227 (+),score=48.58 TRINITY_DN1018_c0_g6_i1:1-681(+)
MKQFWKEYISAMHTGRVAECFDAWMDEDVVWTTDCVAYQAKGIMEVCKLYNQVQERVMGGRDSTVSMRVNDMTYHPKTDSVKIDFISSIRFPGVFVPKVEALRFNIKTTEKMKILKVVVNHIQSTIDPVHGDNDEAKEEEQQQQQQQHLQQQRPCLHNNWDTVRVKRGFALLRCRVCSLQWKLNKVVRCSSYTSPEGCPKGTGCPLLHVNMRKLTSEERAEALRRK